ncbi:NHLP leader peptide family RiPP precursor [Desulfomonile tiedjei]|uniref:TOMM propeptide domain protein n=1 Tax=Desulfomonile tiedjei (strain ATCC 49306 / DSM 6799 / DCB-1) TaxID=706587 RepID=I4C1U6_DESTA|nr:NHLP leader peptide family RiPP precursor [Desulfomonile tiedjei]AFM23537.1 TOMM propeptide domain protein [Desulfomonile tiedjei DSM 6799]
MDRTKFQMTFGKIVAKAWSDEAFKQRLLLETDAVLKEHGIRVPEDIEVKIVENTKELIYITLPLPPNSAEFGKEDVGHLQAAWQFYLR